MDSVSNFAWTETASLNKGFSSFYFKFSFWSFIKNLILSVIAFIVPSALLIPFIVLFTIYFHRRNNTPNVILIGLYAVCVSSEFVLPIYSSVLLFCMFIRKRSDYRTPQASKIFRYLKYFLYYIMVTYVLQLFDEPSILSFPLFIITFVSPSFVLLYIWKMKVSEIDVRYLLKELSMLGIAQGMIAFLLQAVPIGIDALINRPTLGDKVTGTTNSSTSLAIILIFSLIPFVINLFKNYRITINNLVLIGLGIFYTVIIYLNDSKMEMYAVVVSFLAIYGFNVLLNNRNIQKRFLYILFYSTIIAASSTYLYNKYQATLISYADYINGPYDNKLEYYDAAFSTDTRPIYQYLLGTGPGTNGSRASNSLAYDVMYKKNNTNTLPSFIPPKSKTFTKSYISSYFTEEYAIASGFRSAMLGNPYNSVCAAFIEFGLIGFLLLLFIYYSIIKLLLKNVNAITLTAASIVTTNIITAMLDQTWERVLPMFLMFVLIGLAFKRIENNKIQQSL